MFVSCMFKNADGTNRIIMAGEKCLVPTDKCFWKDKITCQKMRQLSVMKTFTNTSCEINLSHAGY